MKSLVHIITHLEAAGAQRVLQRVATRSRDAFDHRVVSLRSGGSARASFDEMGIPVLELGMRPGVSSLRQLPALVRSLRASQPAVVQTWLYHADLLGGLAARAAGVRAISWNLRHGDLDRSTLKFSTIAVAKASARLSRHVPAAIVCCSEATRWTHAALGYDERRMVVIPNGFDLRLWRPDAEARQSVRRELGVGLTAPLVGLIGRLAPQKDHATFFAAARRINRRAELVLCGEGVEPHASELVELARAAGVADRTHLLGVRDDLPRVTASLDVAVLSARSGEGFPNVLAEAMACGVPCVTTDVGDAARIVGDTGAVVSRRDARAMADAIDGLLVSAAPNNDARKRIAQHYSIEATVHAYRELWESL